nr:hypothetical protein Q903MT_gene6036 [Picea sitchensis]
MVERPFGSCSQLQHIEKISFTFLLSLARSPRTVNQNAPRTSMNGYFPILRNKIGKEGFYDSLT